MSLVCMIFVSFLLPLSSQASGIRRNLIICNDLSRMAVAGSNVIIDDDTKKFITPFGTLEILTPHRGESFFTTQGNIVEIGGDRRSVSGERLVDSNALCRATGNNILIGNPNSAAFNHMNSPTSFHSENFVARNPNIAMSDYMN